VHKDYFWSATDQIFSSIRESLCAASTKAACLAVPRNHLPMVAGLIKNKGLEVMLYVVVTIKSLVKK